MLASMYLVVFSRTVSLSSRRCNSVSRPSVASELEYRSSAGGGGLSVMLASIIFMSLYFSARINSSTATYRRIVVKKGRRSVVRQVLTTKYHVSCVLPPLAALWMLKPAVDIKGSTTGEVTK